MKTLILAMFVVAIAAFSHDLNHLLKYLKDIEESEEYRKISLEDKKFFQDLVTAAQTGPSDLNIFINSNSFAKILNLTDHLDDDDIPHFEALLAYYADPTIFIGTRKRQAPCYSDLHAWLHELHIIYKIEEDLDKADKDVFTELMFHLEHCTLTQYIQQVGYAVVFRVLSGIDEDYAHEIDQVILSHLNMEAGLMVSTAGMPPTAAIIKCCDANGDGKIQRFCQFTYDLDQLKARFYDHAYWYGRVDVSQEDKNKFVLLLFNECVVI